MEAAAYVLADDLVGKVWAKRTVAEVRALQQFYDDLHDRDLPFATPLLQHVHQVDGAVVSIERRLPGRPFSSDRRSTEATGMRRLLDVLVALASIEVPSARTLPVIDEPCSPWAQHPSFGVGLIALLESRVARFGTQMRQAVEQFDEKVVAVQQFLLRSASAEHRLFHGDLGGGNLLVDDELNVVSVLDFGFLSGLGDPRFDASIASGVFDMWSPRAQLRQQQFDALLERELGYGGEGLLALRAAYAIVVANAYDVDGQDGQFWWSTTFLNRPDVHHLLLSL